MIDGVTFPLKDAFSAYMTRWYRGLYADTKGVIEFTQRNIERCIVWAPGRMVDAAEEMLAAYRKNDNDGGAHGKGALLPVVIIGMAKDYNPTGVDMGGMQVRRQLITITDEPDASIYGYRQAHGDVRTQVVIFAAEEASAKSLAAQFLWFIAQVENRRFKTSHTFGEYGIQLSATIENPDTVFMNIVTEQKNLTMLAADITLRALFPYFDAPKVGEPNDGTAHNPPGYPAITQISSTDKNVLTLAEITEEDGVVWQ